MAGYLKRGISATRKLIVIVMFTITVLMGLFTVFSFGRAFTYVDEPERERPVARDENEMLRNILEDEAHPRPNKSSRYDGFIISFVLLGMTLGSLVITRKFQNHSLKKIEQNSENLKAIEDRMAAELRVKVAQRQERQDFRKKAKNRSRIGVLKVTVLGGAGWEAKAKQKLLMTADETDLYLGDATKAEETVIPLAALSQVQIAGAGTIQSGGGFGGGGFGGEGFLIGAGIATVLNALTTRTTTETVIYLRFRNEELVLLNDELSPEAMRIRLSPIYVALPESEIKQNPDISTQLAKLSELKNQGLLSEEEFALAKRKLLSDIQ